MKITVNRIAELAGVSRGTVDRVLHNRPGVRDEVREKILEIIKTLEYTPNLAGKALVSQNKNIFFGVVLAPDFHPFVEEIREGVKSQAKEIKEFGVDVSIEVIKSLDSREQLVILDDLEKRGVSGIAIVPILEDCISRKLNEMISQGIPVITFNSDIKDTNRLCFVGQDNVKAGKTAFALFQQILAPGSKIAIITSSKELACHVDRVHGFVTSQQSSSSDFELVGVVENQDQDEKAFEQVMKFCSDHPDLKGIYLTGGGATGLGKGLKIAMKADQVKVISHDIVPPVIDLMREGIIKFTIGQNPFMQGALPIKLLFDYTFKKLYPDKEEYHTNLDIRIKENL